MAHDHRLHYTGYSRTLRALVVEAKVSWVNMDKDVREYVGSCLRCQIGKAASHKVADVGTLQPTLAPWYNHTWYIDLKGPLPHDTGYILVVVEALSRMVKLRYAPACTVKEICEELMEVINGFGTSPLVVRSDNGPPFNSEEFKRFCDSQGIQVVLGVPYHHQGQGLVETKIKGIAGAIIATLGHKAPREWFKGKTLDNLEGIINSTIVSSTGMSPYAVAHGREPRTPLARVGDWSSEAYWEGQLGMENATFNDFNEIVAAHHDAMDAAQGLAALGSSVSQALTKREWDAARKPSDYKEGEWVLVHCVAPNRLTPWFNGPYQVTSITGDGNVVRGRHYLDPPEKESGPYHVSRLVRFDFSRATPQEIAQFQLDSGSNIVDDVLGHRTLADGTNEFHIKWLGYAITSWLPSTGLVKVIKVIKYCEEKGLPAPGKEPRVVTEPRPRAARKPKAGKRK
jgi:hypothetical protein